MVSVPGTAILTPGRSLDVMRLAGDDHRAVLVAHAAPGRQQRVLVEQVRVGVDADGRDFEFALQRPAIERLDVLQFVDELQVARGDLVVRQGVEHEGVVRVRAVPDADQLV